MKADYASLGAYSAMFRCIFYNE